jgi:hypothetical protein
MDLSLANSTGLNCVRCGNGQLLSIGSGRQGFLETGWRVDFSLPEQVSFICGICADASSQNPLPRQKQYLDHIFEAQQRFGE